MGLRISWIPLLSILLSGIAGPAPQAADYGLTSSLKGLKGVRVAMGGFRDGATEIPGDEEARTAAEAELRKAGIRVYRMSDPQDVKTWKAQGEPTLIVRIITGGEEERKAAVLLFETVQKSSLARNGAQMNAVTWSENFLLTNPSRESVLDSLRSNLLYFINDYISANRK